MLYLFKIPPFDVKLMMTKDVMAEITAITPMVVSLKFM